MTFLAWQASNTKDEFVKVYEAILACVKVFEKNARFPFRNVNAQVFEAPVEFLLVEQSVSIRVEHIESTAKAANCVFLLEEVASDSLKN